MTRKNLLPLILIIFIALLASCISTPHQLPSGLMVGEKVAPTANKDSEIRSGSYHRIDISGAEPDPIALGVTGVEIDRQNKIAIFALKDGSKVKIPLSKIDSPVWGQGCPTIVNATRMEILYFAIDSFILDGVTFEEPMLVATCPAPSLTFVLREAGSGLGDFLPATACDWWAGAKCIYFAQDYATLQGKIVDVQSNATLQDAQITFSSPAGSQSFTGGYHLSLPAGAVIDFTIRAPGYQDSTGKIEISHNAEVYNTITFQFKMGVHAEEPAKVILIEDPTVPVEWDFPLTPESPYSTLPADSGDIYVSKHHFQVLGLPMGYGCVYKQFRWSQKFDYLFRG